MTGVAVPELKPATFCGRLHPTYSASGAPIMTLFTELVDASGNPIGSSSNPMHVNSSGALVFLNPALFATNAGTDAYTTGLCIGGTLEFTGIVADDGDPAAVRTILLKVNTATPRDLVLYLFWATPGEYADLDPYAPTMADPLFSQISFPASDFTTYNNVATQEKSIAISAPLTGTSLFALLINVDASALTLASTAGLGIVGNIYRQ